MAGGGRAGISFKSPRSNLLRFSFQGGGYAMARPSGTEPKIRFYFCVRGETQQEARERLAAVKEEFLRLAGVNSCSVFDGLVLHYFMAR